MDVWKGSPRSVAVDRDPDCEVCVKRRFSRLENPTSSRAAVLCGRDAVQLPASGAVDLAALQTTLEPLGEVRANDYVLRFRRPPHEITIFEDGRAIIKGVRDVADARSVHARYIGA